MKKSAAMLKFAKQINSNIWFGCKLNFPNLHCSAITMVETPRLTSLKKVSIKDSASNIDTATKNLLKYQVWPQTDFSKFPLQCHYDGRNPTSDVDETSFNPIFCLKY